MAALSETPQKWALGIKRVYKREVWCTHIFFRTRCRRGLVFRLWVLTRDQVEGKVFRLGITLWYYVDEVVVVRVLSTNNLNPNLNCLIYPLNPATASAAALKDWNIVLGHKWWPLMPDYCAAHDTSNLSTEGNPKPWLAGTMGGWYKPAANGYPQ